ncbi:hemK methyltransferase family member 2 [Anoplophora glabripennis]|uniref:hemK methyltransferase family member 2 n=1 Tax=Anoplophora glabripennis TaxID=217634 RepID=UPI000873C954|nr:hemK methyltransferase family member 2 [Anoplophora glabripennis]
MTLDTPKYNLNKYPEVYEPSEDTFLLLDALEADTSFLLNLKPKIAVEIGSGSGVIITGLASLLKNSCLYFSTDINPQACLATQNTARLNGAPIECINMDLLLGFKNRMFDIILFNPPYVVTDSEELSGSGLNRAWAGGTNGREIIDRLSCNISDMLTPEGICYLLLLKENNPQEVVSGMKGLGFDSELVLQRKIPGEFLYVYKFFRRK